MTTINQTSFGRCENCGPQPVKKEKDTIYGLASLVGGGLGVAGAEVARRGYRVKDVFEKKALPEEKRTEKINAFKETVDSDIKTKGEEVETVKKIKNNTNANKARLKSTDKLKTEQQALKDIKNGLEKEDVDIKKLKEELLKSSDSAAYKDAINKTFGKLKSSLGTAIKENRSVPKWLSAGLGVGVAVGLASAAFRDLFKEG